MHLHPMSDELQVAVDLTKPSGRVLGIDLIPVQPPKGASAMQGNFMSPEIQAEMKHFLRDPDRGRVRRSTILTHQDDDQHTHVDSDVIRETTSQSYLDLEREENSEQDDGFGVDHENTCIDVVLSDMCEPWELLDGRYKRSINNPYTRLMNTSGNAFRDHAGSMVSGMSAYVSQC